MKTLTIRLAGPLQSYGNEATFARRTSGDYPSKSAVVGMLAAALGYRRADPRIAALNELAFAVRIDQPVRVLTEFQTIEWKKGTRKLSYRDLLQDAVFVAAVGSDDDELIASLAAALKHPRFQLFLGRRANVPAGVLKCETFVDRDPIEALHDLPWQAADWYQHRLAGKAEVRVDVYADAHLLPKAEAAVRVAKDRVESFDQRDRRFSFRTVKHASVTFDNSAMQTEHDIWANL